VVSYYATDAAFTYRMLQVIHDEDGQPHIVNADSSLPVNTCIIVVVLLWLITGMPVLK